ncbi:hypothetical protein LCGC14_3009160, partial [marine sediment metagenome]
MFEGQFFIEWRRERHVVSPYEIPENWKKVRSIDPSGKKGITSCHWYAVDYDKIIYLYREWYGCRNDDEQEVGLRKPAFEVARELWDHEKEKVKMRIADPSIWHPRPKARFNEARGQTIVEDFSNEGVYFLKADNNRLQGLQAVHRRL